MEQYICFLKKTGSYMDTVPGNAGKKSIKS